MSMTHLSGVTLPVTMPSLGVSSLTPPAWAFAAQVGGFWARLPIPPSLNNMFVNMARKSGGRVRSRDYKKWATDAGWLIKDDQKRQAPIFGRFAVALLISEKESGDADNRFKAIGDLLVSYGVTEDDKLNDMPLTMRCSSVARGTCEVIAIPATAIPDLLDFLASTVRMGCGGAGVLAPARPAQGVPAPS
jgi:hypothetical protein